MAEHHQGHQQRQDQGPSNGMRIGDVSFAELMALEPHGPDISVAIAPKYPWGRLFGGQVVAQGLRAAQATVDPGYQVHSLHAYFIRGGTHAEPVRYEVDRIRNGRSFVTRRVVARQSSGAILNMSASFQVTEHQADVQSMQPPPDVPAPDGLPDTGWGGLMERRLAVTEFGRTISWVRLNDSLLREQDGPVQPDGQMIACSLAFVSDSVPTGAVRAAHPLQVPREKIRETFQGASLDHAVYFQRPAPANEWLLCDTQCHGLVGGRGVSVGNVFDPQGVQVMTIVQEVLLRQRTDISGIADPSS